MKESFKVALMIIMISIGITFAASYLVAGETFVPQEFIEGRIEGALLAKEIVSLADTSLSNLEVIYRYNANREYHKALAVVSEEIPRIATMQEKANLLSLELEKMNSSLTNIKPNKAKNIAKKAIDSELLLVDHLIAYNDYLSELFQTLKESIEASRLQPSQNIEVLVAKINEETKAINELDVYFNEVLGEFDEIFK